MFFIYPGYFVVPREVKTLLMQNLFSGGAEGKLRYILGNRKSSSGELLNEIVVTEGNLGTVSSLKTPKLSPAQKTIPAVTQNGMQFVSF